MQEITHIISTGRDLVASVDQNSNGTSWIKERLAQLEGKNSELLSKIEERRKKLSQGVEFYTHFEQVSILSFTYDSSSFQYCIQCWFCSLSLSPSRYSISL